MQIEILLDMRTLSSSLFLALSILLLFSSCDKNKNNNTDGYNRKAMLENYADKLIIPAYAQLQQKANTLKTAADNFTQQPDNTTLLNFQNAWKETAKTFQFCNSFNFGPAETLTGNFTIDVATFPVNETLTEDFVSQMANNGFDPLNNFSRDTRGIYGIEYLIFKNDAAQTISNFSDEKRKNYLTAIITDFKTRTDKVTADWQLYRTTFVAADGTDAGSGASMLFNQFLIGFENNKNFKLGLPLGLRVGQTTTAPNKVAAYYSGISTELVKLNFESTMQIYFGNDFENQQGLGFDDYLKSVDSGEALVSETITQMNKVKDAINNIPQGKLSDVIVSDFAKPDAAHTEMAKLTRYIKSDMSSLLGLSITFSSGDGD